jgi:heat shock protein HtpX
VAAFGWMPLLLLPIGIAFLVVGELCHVVVAWFSRVRELEADAGAARLTGNPAGLASALIALSETGEAIPLADLRRAATTDVFHIVAMGKERRLARTHPSLKRRLAQLDELERRLQRAHPAGVG